ALHVRGPRFRCALYLLYSPPFAVPYVCITHAQALPSQCLISALRMRGPCLRRCLMSALHMRGPCLRRCLMSGPWDTKPYKQIFATTTQIFLIFSTWEVVQVSNNCVSATGHVAVAGPLTSAVSRDTVVVPGTASLDPCALTLALMQGPGCIFVSAACGTETGS